MPRAGLLLVATALAVSGCSSSPDHGMRAFDDADTDYSPKRARIICESRADHAAREAGHRAREAIRDGAWSASGAGVALADVEQRVYRSRLRGCLAEFGYYLEDDSY